MRGKDAAVLAAVHTPRITPAYAGKSGNVDHDYSYIEDHPRLCGEKKYLCAWHNGGRGSPPPMRGKEGLSKRQRNYFGITPAYAGKSFCLLHKKCSV